MEEHTNDYHFSFFRPTTDSARRNRNMVLQLVLIWAVAIFGFQVLLKILEKPTPEPVYAQFASAWKNINTGEPTSEDLRNAGQAALSVLGKVAIKTEHRLALDNAVSWMAFQMADSAQKLFLLTAVENFERAAESTDLISDADYVDGKEQTYSLISEPVRS